MDPSSIETLHKDLLQGCEIAQEVNPHWVWFNERVGKVKMHLEKIEERDSRSPRRTTNQLSWSGRPFRRRDDILGMQR